MPEQSKFSGALSKLNQSRSGPARLNQRNQPQPDQPPADAVADGATAALSTAGPPLQEASKLGETIPRQARPRVSAPPRASAPTQGNIIAESGRGKGRPPGKRSDPDFQPTTVLLRKATKRTAVRKLEDADTDQDLSELIEQLLSDWIQQRG